MILNYIYLYFFNYLFVIDDFRLYIRNMEITATATQAKKIQQSNRLKCGVAVAE